MALVTVLAIILICSIFITLAYYFVYRGTEVSGIERRYKTAKEATFGALEVFTKEVIPLGISGTCLSSILSRFPEGTVERGGLSDECFSSKLLESVSAWPSGCDSSMDLKGSYDLLFSLRGETSAEVYRVYLKVVDTVKGNTSTSGPTLEGAGVTEVQAGIIPVRHFPYLYKVELQGEKEGSSERVNLSVLYAY